MNLFFNGFHVVFMDFHGFRMSFHGLSMVFHGFSRCFRRLFKPTYMPTPLSFAVRRSERHSPEGLVTLEENGMPATRRHSLGTLSLWQPAFQVPLTFIHLACIAMALSCPLLCSVADLRKPDGVKKGEAIGDF